MIKSIPEIIEFLKTTNFNIISQDILEKEICSFGLNDEILNEQPISLNCFYGKGLKIWQYPNQFSHLIRWLSNKKINSYLEIGCRFGGTFIIISELLRKNNPNIKLTACDLIDESLILNEYRQYYNFNYLKMNSQTEEFKNIIKDDIEMVLIDGDHTYAGCYSDWKLFESNKNTKYIIFHDIFSSVCPGVVQLWNEIKNDTRFTSIEFIDQYPINEIPAKNNFLGIGILERK